MKFLNINDWRTRMSDTAITVLIVGGFIVFVGYMVYKAKKKRDSLPTPTGTSGRGNKSNNQEN